MSFGVLRSSSRRSIVNRDYSGSGRRWWLLAGGRFNPLRLGARIGVRGTPIRIHEGGGAIEIPQRTLHLLDVLVDLALHPRTRMFRYGGLTLLAVLQLGRVQPAAVLAGELCLA